MLLYEKPNGSYDIVTKGYVDEAVKNKVDNVDGKALSSNDFTDEYKSKLDKIDAEANKTVVDDSLSDISENPVQNKVIANELTSIETNKANISYVDEKAIETYYALRRTGKVYQTKLWKFNTNPTASGEKLLDNAGLVFEPSTDTVIGQDDYADIPLFQWQHCNYIREDNCDVKITALEGTENYATTGSVDVGTMGMTFYWNWDESNDEYTLITISDSPHPELGLVPWVESVRADGTISPYWCHAAYPSVLATDGLLRSQPNGKMEVWQSYNNMITNYQKKGKGYWGGGISRNTFQIIFNTIKGATKDSQSLYAGVTNWNFQYSAAVERDTKDTYFPVTASQAANLEVGCYVSVGYGSNNNGALYIDRGVSSVRKYADDVKILRIEDMDDGNKAVYLDVEEGFDTMSVALTDTLSAPITMSSWHMYTGETDNVKGHYDGSNVSNKSGRHSYRVMGTEYALGAWMVASDAVMDFQSDYSKNVYIAPKGVSHSSNDSTIRNTYTLFGNIPANSNGNGSDYWTGDISLNTDFGSWYPSVQGNGSTQGVCDYLWAGGTATSGTREFLQCGALGNGSSAGASLLHCWLGLGDAYWSYGGSD